jgi:hypothetical protein
MSVAASSADYLPLAAFCGFWICIYFAWRDFRYARALADTPTAKIRSAPQGYVELVGHAQPGPQGETVAPLSGVSCVWHRYVVEKRGSKGKWTTLHRGVSDQPFLLMDETGECLIYPDGAEVVRTHRKSWRGNDPMYQKQSTGGLVGSVQAVGKLLNGFSIGGQRYRYTEHRIMPGDPLHALGHFRTVGGASELPDRRGDLAELLEGWKHDDQRMALFDRDGNGKLDAAEWGAAVSAAERQLNRDILRRPDDPEIHTLSNNSTRGRPFLLSSASQSRLVRGYQIRAAAATAGLVVSGGYLVILFG